VGRTLPSVNPTNAPPDLQFFFKYLFGAEDKIQGPVPDLGKALVATYLAEEGFLREG
jgi:hypothetical protein